MSIGWVHAVPFPIKLPLTSSPGSLPKESLLLRDREPSQMREALALSHAASTLFSSWGSLGTSQVPAPFLQCQRGRIFFLPPLTPPAWSIPLPPHSGPIGLNEIPQDCCVLMGSWLRQLPRDSCGQGDTAENSWVNS